MRLRHALLIAAAFIVGAVFSARADLTYTQGSGTTIFDFVCFTTKHCSAHALINSTGTEIGSTILSSLQGSTPAGTAYIGKTRATDGTNDSILDPCQTVAKSKATISQAASAQVIAGTSNKKTYVCSISFLAADAENISVVEGTGSVCATGIAAVYGSTTAANGLNFPAGGGITFGNGLGSVMQADAALADNVCILQSGSGRVAGVVLYVQQ